MRLIAETAAAVPWLLYEGEAELTASAAEPAGAAESAPGRREFLEALYGHLLISGNAYVELVEPARTRANCICCRPDRVAVSRCGGLAGGAGIPHGQGRGAAADWARRARAALHLALFHPLDDHCGFPPLEAALIALDTHNAAGRWNKALLDNSARPSGALVYAPKEGGNLTEEQFDRLKAELEEGYSGAARAGRPLLLEGGLDWKAMGLTPKDMDFIEAKHSASRDIALAFGVPPMLLGIPGDNTYANYQEANRAFYRMTVLPLVARTAKELSAWLAPVFGEELRLWYDADQSRWAFRERDALWARVGAADF